MVTAYFFIVLAAGSKAVADTLQHHFDKSIFNGLNSKWWNPKISGDFVSLFWITKYRIDAWHLANSSMIVFFISAVIFHTSYFSWYIELILFGGLFNAVFNILYNKVLLRK